MRTRRIRSFAVPFVCVVAASACDRSPGGGDDAGDDAGDVDGWPITENPPAPSIGTECFVQAPRSPYDSACQASVCNVDPACCATAWDETCVELAQAACYPDATCTEEAILIASGPALASVSVFGRATSVTPPQPLPDDGVIGGLAVAYHDARGPVIAIASECAGRVVEVGPGLALQERFRGDLDGCVDAPSEQRWQGRRAAWADLDRDGSIDAVFAGAGGAWWARTGPGTTTWSRGFEIVPAADGRISDLALVDADLDGDVDALVTFEQGAARLYRQGDGGAFAADAWASALTGHTSAAACQLDDSPTREIVVGGPAGVESYRIEAGGIGAPTWGDSGVVTALAGATHVGCGRISEDRAIIAHGVDGVIRSVVDGAAWWSTMFDDPPTAVPGAGVAIHGGRAAIADATADGDRPVLVLAGNLDGALLLAPVADPAPDAATTAIAPLPTVR